MVQEYKRNCPECGKELVYSCNSSWNRSLKNNCLCRSCSKLGKRHPLFGKKATIETRLKMSASISGVNNPMFGKHLSEKRKLKLKMMYLGKKRKPFTAEHCKNISISARQRCLINNTGVSIGLNETFLLDRQEILENIIISRQYRINKLGYIVDGYCKENNTVYEVYEKPHKRIITKNKDIKRQKEIQKYLSCAFVIIKDGW